MCLVFQQYTYAPMAHGGDVVVCTLMLYDLYGIPTVCTSSANYF